MNAPQSAPKWAAELELADAGLLPRLLRLDLLVARLLDHAAAAEGISAPDHLVLGVLRRSPGHQSAPTRICELLGRSTGGMTLTLDRLAANGWITREPDPRDRRRVMVTLTPLGLDVTTRVNDRLHAWEASLGLDPRTYSDAIADVDRLLDLFEAQPTIET
jgi:DNA-binding MarR family transcriptional regulator